MTSLKALQDSFQRGILAGDDAVLAEIDDSSGEDRSVRFGIYRHAYVARLAEVLGEDYPHLHAYLGDARFARLAQTYIGAHPSDRRSVRDFGRHVPDFLRTRAEWCAHTELAEIAALEKALLDAFDGKDAAPLRLEDLGKVAPEAWPRLILHPHPTATRLSLMTNAADLWGALQDGVAPPTLVRHEEPQALMVWRYDVTARFRQLSPEEAMMWDEASRGTRFGVLCEMVATHGGEDGAELRAASYLKDWVCTGMLAGFRTAPERKGRSRQRPPA